MNEPDPILIGLRGYKSRELLRPILVRHNMTWLQAIAKDRHTEYLRVREDIYAALRMAGFSLPQIGKMVGGRDHTTVFHNLRKWEQRQKASVDSYVQRSARRPEEELAELFSG